MCACTLYFHGSNCYVNTQQCYFVCTLPLFKKLITGFVPSQQLPGFVAAFDMLPYLVVVSNELLLFLNVATSMTKYCLGDGHNLK